MNSMVKRFNARVPWPFRLLLVVVIGFGLREVVIASILTGWAVTRKLSDRATVCPWSRVASYYFDLAYLDKQRKAYEGFHSVVEIDEDLDLTLISSPGRSFWITTAGGASGLADLRAEQDMVAQKSPESAVREGDIVLDCGAHVGVFTNKALALGAARVIALEPNPANAECYRRNFEKEITSGRVILVTKGVWSHEKTLRLYSGATTAHNSIVRSLDGSGVEIEVTTIDLLVEELNLPRVDYVKMDIQGAEEGALKGARATLRRFRPRLMIDRDRRDDIRVLPEIIRQANPDYEFICGPCEALLEDSSILAPHVLFFR